MPFLDFRVNSDLSDGIRALECAKAHELPKYRSCLLSILAALERREPVNAQLKALLAMAPVRRYRANALPTHRHGLTLDGQLALHCQLRSGRVAPLPPASTNKETKLVMLECWQDELESLQSLATSDGSGPDELPSLVASSDEDDAWEEEDDVDDAWGSPPSSPHVTPALIARLGTWIASSAQAATPGSPPRPIFRRILPAFG